MDGPTIWCLCVTHSSSHVSSFKPHSLRFRARRVINWFPLGLAYAFLYMGRYNLTVSKNALGSLMTKADFGEIFGIGAIVYGLAFVVNGPLTDKIGGRKAMLIGVLGAIVSNVAMGFVLLGITNWGWTVPIFSSFMWLYALNMYFQSFGAVAIVTTKAPWFHVRERGTFSTIFGVMISLGVYFAFDWGYAIMQATRSELGEMSPMARFFHMVLPIQQGQGDQNWWLFFTPAIILAVLWVILLLFLRNTPGEAGYANFETGEDSLSKDGQRLPVSIIFKKILSHPVLLVICGIEFCSGVVRNGVMQWYPIFAKEVGFYTHFFVTQNWGAILLVCGIAGSVMTGWASDRFFQSRRAPMAAILYVVMFVCTIVMTVGLTSSYWWIGIAVMVVSMNVIGVHGIMSGTSTADFGGAKNTGTAVGIVDGLVYLGTALQSLAAGYMTPTGDAAKQAGNWLGWPLFLVPFALIGWWLSVRIWHAIPRKAATPTVAEEFPLSEEPV